MTNTETTKRNRNQNLVSRLMVEHVRVPGFPQIVVTREFLYGFLRGCGWNPCERGFGSIDYMAFGRAAVAEELTSDAARDHLLAQVRDGYAREAVAA